MKSLIKNTYLRMAAIAVLGLSLAACDESDIAAIAIGAGIIAICSDSDVNCSASYGYDHYHRRGRHHRRGRDHHHRRGRRHGGHSVATVSSTAHMTTAPAVSIEELGQVNIVPAHWAKTFKMKVDSSKQIITAFEDARAGELETLKDLGLKNKDLRRLAKLEMPREKGIKRIAKKLGEPIEVVGSMMETLVEIANEEVEN